MILSRRFYWFFIGILLQDCYTPSFLREPVFNTISGKELLAVGRVDYEDQNQLELISSGAHFEIGFK
jgi:hypothetical protein